MRLSPCSIDLLRASQGHPDFAAFRRHAEDIDRRYSDREVDLRLRELSRLGLIFDQGDPTKGWLTPKGRAALERHPS